MYRVALAFLFLFVGQALFVLSQLVAARAFGAEPTKVVFGIGPRARFRIADVRFEVAPVPLLAYVELAGMIDDEGPPRGFRALHPLKKILIVLGAWVLPLIVAMALLGPLRGMQQVVRTPWQLLRGVFDAEDAVTYLRLFFALPRSAALGVLLAKMVAFNLLPFPGLAGARILQYLGEWLFPNSRLINAKKHAWLHTIGLIAILGILVKWGYAGYLLATSSATLGCPAPRLSREVRATLASRDSRLLQGSPPARPPARCSRLCPRTPS